MCWALAFYNYITWLIVFHKRDFERFTLREILTILFCNIFNIKWKLNFVGAFGIYMGLSVNKSLGAGVWSFIRSSSQFLCLVGDDTNAWQNSFPWDVYILVNTSHSPATLVLYGAHHFTLCLCHHTSPASSQRYSWNQ